MSNKVTLTFAGDAKDLIKENKRVVESTKDVADSTTSAAREQEGAVKSTGALTDRLSKLGNITSGATDALDNAGASMQALVDIQQAGAQRAAALARALNDMEQAQEDANQAVRDFKQAGIDSKQATLDVKQANLDAASAMRDYRDAVKEHGKGSIEARQAQIDLQQAGIDLSQANEDSAQATRDATQANIDGRAAQLDFNEAQREANPPDMQKWADQIGLVTPLLTGLVSVVALATAAQWSLNLAWLASPITWIVLGVAALVAAIVLIATKTTWFQTAWKASWSAIKTAASATWDFLKKIPGGIETVFKKVAGFVSAPFRAGFNLAAKAWNNTIGRLSWTVPGWIPGIGGNSISVPNLPTFHQGGHASGALGGEFMAILQAGERVTATGGGTGGGALTVQALGGSTTIDRAMAEVVATLINRGALKLTVRDGRVQAAHG